MSKKIGLCKSDIEALDKKCNINPRGTIIILVQEEYTTSQIKNSGLIIPEEAKKGGSLEAFEGFIIRTGSDINEDEFPKYLKVVFGKNDFSVLNHYGTEYLMLRDYDIIGDLEIDPEVNKGF